MNFIVEGSSAMPDFTAMAEADWARRADDFRPLPGETLAVSWMPTPKWPARQTSWSPPDLGASQPLPATLTAPVVSAGPGRSALRRTATH